MRLANCSDGEDIDSDENTADPVSPRFINVVTVSDPVSGAVLADSVRARPDAYPLLPD
jgi:hypothetical protein